MAGLWADAWLYISALGFFASLTLFFYLLGLYRCAVERSDDSFVLAPPVDAAKPLPNLPEEDSLQVPGVTPILESESEKDEIAATLPLPETAASDVPVQDVRSEMERFDKEISALSDIVSRQVAQGEMVLKRLLELSESVKSRVSSGAPVAAPAAKEQPLAKATPVPIPAPAPVEPHRESVEPVSGPPPQHAPTPAAVPEQTQEPRRKGPVWPV